VVEFDEERELPWPRSGDHVFISGDDWWMNACVNWGGGWTLYAIGYRNAGDVLVERVEQDRGEADALVYPIVFCYRQYLELMLKDTLMEARRYCRIEEPFDATGRSRTTGPCRRDRGRRGSGCSARSAS
jgi:hypothetical protein